jgi:pimeloyl-ACP methyl ester carboxylesterase
MADQLRALEGAAASAGQPGPVGVPLVVISSGNQPPGVMAAHQALARMSSQGRQVVATSSGHWVQFDEPALVVDAIRDVVHAARRPRPTGPVVH